MRSISIFLNFTNSVKPLFFQGNVHYKSLSGKLPPESTPARAKITASFRLERECRHSLNQRVFMQSLWMLAASFFFSLMGLCIKLAATHHNLAEIVLVRGIPSVILLAGFALYHGRALFGNHLRVHAVRNVSGVSSMWMGFYAMTHLPLGLATTLNYTSPLFLAAFVLYTSYFPGILRAQWLRFSAVIIGFIGVMLIFNPFSEVQLNHFAILVGLLCGALASVAYMSVRSLGLLGEPEWRTVMLFSMSTTLTGIVGVVLLGFSPNPTWQSVLALIGIGLAGMVAQLCMTRAFGSGHPVLTATLQYSTIIFSTIWGELLWQERISLSGFIGMALVMFAGLSATLYSLKHKQ